MTPAYCSPEQAEIAAQVKAGLPREAWPKLTRGTDVWSWAVSVLEMFRGKVDWPSGAVAGHYLKRSVDDPRIPLMPPALVELLERCLQRVPQDRPRNLSDIADALRGIYEQVTGRPHPRELPEAAVVLADSLNNRGVSLLDLGKPQEAEKAWQEALCVDPNHPEVIYNWGLIQWRSARITDEQLLGKLHDAGTSCADPARLDPLVGLVHLERNDCETAIQVLTEPETKTAGKSEIASALATAQADLNDSARFLRSFEGHKSGVTSVAWSPDGCFALSGSYDKTVRLWEVSSGRSLRSLKGHREAVCSVAWSPDGRLALSGSAIGDSTLRLWDVSTGRCLRTFTEHRSGVKSVAWSPDGRFALSGSGDGPPWLWEVSSGRWLRSFEARSQHDVTSVAWSPNGRFALSGRASSQGQRFRRV
jgi:hypothetical protein